MSKQPSIREIENAFLPAKEITDASRFAGRKEYVESAFYALLTEGTNIAIIGNRGIGKSSLAMQLQEISGGKNDLLRKLKINDNENLDFLTFYYACGGSVTCHHELLEKLLTSKNCLLDWSYDIPKARNFIEKYTPKFSVGFASLGGEKSTKTTTQTSQPEHDIETVFTNVVSSICEEKLAQNGIMFIIDEFDQIKDKTGFASFLKALATNVPNVRFCIVGVAHDINELIADHASTDRLFAGGIINLPPMSNTELEEIIRDAEKSIGNFIKFDQNATNKVVNLSQGHPYIVHLLGKYSLRTIYKNSRKSICDIDIDNTLKSIANEKTDLVLEDRYKKAVGSSAQREIVLKSLAQTQTYNLEIHTKDAYKKAIDLGVDNPSQFVGSLVTEDFGAEIVKIRDRYYRFKDSLFVAYVNARPHLHELKG